MWITAVFGNISDISDIHPHQKEEPDDEDEDEDEDGGESREPMTQSE